MVDLGLATQFSASEPKLTTCCGSPAFHVCPHIRAPRANGADKSESRDRQCLSASTRSSDLLWVSYTALICAGIHADTKPGTRYMVYSPNSPLPPSPPSIPTRPATHSSLHHAFQGPRQATRTRRIVSPKNPLDPFTKLQPPHYGS